MPDNLARFARLSLQAKTRLAIERDGRLNTSEAWYRDWAQELWQARKRRLALEAEGPPDKCYLCYRIAESYPFNEPYWDHGEPVNPVERPWDESYPELERDPVMVEFCTHECHGPDGYPLPVIGYA